MASKAKPKFSDLLAKPLKAKKKKPTSGYDCSKCISACCGFPVIELTMAEIKVIAKHEKKTGKRFRPWRDRHFEPSADGGWQFKRKPHDSLGHICVFHKENVGCSVYKARPETCRSYGHDGQCTIYSFLRDMRKHTGIKDYFPAQLHI